MATKSAVTASRNPRVSEPHAEVSTLIVRVSPSRGAFWRRGKKVSQEAEYPPVGQIK